MLRGSTWKIAMPAARAASIAGRMYAAAIRTDSAWVSGFPMSTEKNSGTAGPSTSPTFQRCRATKPVSLGSSANSSSSQSAVAKVRVRQCRPRSRSAAFTLVAIVVPLSRRLLPCRLYSLLLTRTLHLLSKRCQVGGAHVSYDYTNRLQASQGDPVQHGAMLAGIPRIETCSH